MKNLLAAGEWLKTNGKAIYGAGRTPFGAELGHHSAVLPDHYGERKFIQINEWRATTKPGKIFVHIFQWPKKGDFYLPTPATAINPVYMLGDAARTPLKLTRNRDYITIKLPTTAPDPIATVLCVELETAR